MEIHDFGWGFVILGEDTRSWVKIRDFGWGFTVLGEICLVEKPPTHLGGGICVVWSCGEDAGGAAARGAAAGAAAVAAAVTAVAALGVAAAAAAATTAVNSSMAQWLTHTSLI